MPRSLYTLLLYLWLPWHVLAVLWRDRAKTQPFANLLAHLARGLAPRTDRPLWIHAASVGEVYAARALLAAFREQFPQIPLLLTVGTAAGLARARSLLPAEQWAQLALCPAPWDLPAVVRRFLDANQPRALAVIETELWPNLVAATAARGVPLVLASARMSARSQRRYLRWAPELMSATVRSFRWIGAQSEADRERFLALGADPARVQVTGNLKFDAPLPEDIFRRGTELRARIAPARPLWVAGSTHAVEEAICLEAHRKLEATARSRGVAAPLLVLAPRRPERFGAVAKWLASQNVSGAGSASGAGFRASSSVLLLDQLGELLTCYAAADVAFVGGSLVPVGGHNLLEPAALAKPVLTGPHTFNSPEAGRLLEEGQALRRVADASSLASVLQEFLDDPALARATGERGAAAVAANRGAAARALDALTAALVGEPASLPEPEPPQAPSASG